MRREFTAAVLLVRHEQQANGGTTAGGPGGWQMAPRPRLRLDRKSSEGGVGRPFSGSAVPIQAALGANGN